VAQAAQMYFGRKKFEGGPKLLALGDQQYSCLGRRFSKRKMTSHTENFGGNWPHVFGQGYASRGLIGFIIAL